jgi:hypothetical protein
MYKIINTWQRLLFITGIIVLLMCPCVSGESSVTMNSKFCMNGHCTFTSTGYPDYYQYQYPYFSGYPSSPYNPSYNYYCSPYRTVNYQGYLSAGQYRVYGFRIGGTRSYIEWALNGGCGYSGVPVMMSMGATRISSWRQASCGAIFDLYVYQNRYPCFGCRADRWDTSWSSNAYVGMTNPCPGCFYSVVVYCRSGSGYYDLSSSSYVSNCWYPYGPVTYGSGSYDLVMMSSVEQMMSAGSDNVLMSGESGSFDPASIVWVEDGSVAETREGGSGVPPP